MRQDHPHRTWPRSCPRPWNIMASSTCRGSSPTTLKQGHQGPDGRRAGANRLLLEHHGTDKTRLLTGERSGSSTSPIAWPLNEVWTPWLPKDGAPVAGLRAGRDGGAGGACGDHGHGV